ncbi:MAG: hypothetical protein JJ974_01120 [Phycisphaerales bacterium]|nr:hypothetical protein [Phycisphaerales bacterium]
MNTITFVLASLIFVLTLTGCATTQQLSEEFTPEQYHAALDAIMESDQRYRTAISWGTTDPEELARLEALDDDESMAEYVRRNKEGIELDPEVEQSLWDKQIPIDKKNTRELMRLVDAHGWPTHETAGEGFASPIPVLIHMTMEDAEWVLPKLYTEVIEGRMDPGPYAMIYDRKQQHDGKPQLYGKMQAFDSKTMSVLPPAIVDIDETNRARAKIGMEPLEEYRITSAEVAAGG